MYRDRRVAVVIPARDEAPFIAKVILTLPDFVDDAVVVDDGSRDATAEAARSTGDPRVAVLRSVESLGVGGAMVLGYRTALELGADLIVKMDGDGQMRPEYVAGLLDALLDDGVHYAKGNRFLHPGLLSAMPTARLVGNMALTFMTKLASGYWQVFDPQNGYTAVRAECLRVLDLDAIHRGYFFENDMLVRLNVLGFRVKDVPIPARYGDEQSGLSLTKAGIVFPVLLTRRYFWRIYQKYVLRDFSPIALFLFLGLGLFGWGMGLGLYVWARTILTGRPTPLGTTMLALLPLILGFQLLLQAIVLEIQESRR